MVVYIIVAILVTMILTAILVAVLMKFCCMGSNGEGGSAQVSPRA